MMEPTSRLTDQQRVLEAADRVARAAYLWVRHGDGVGFASDARAGRHDIVAGIILGLCTALDLDQRHALLSAYAYALIDGDAGEALVVARSMLRTRDEEPNRSDYRQGLREASNLLALLAAPDTANEWPLPA